MNQLPVAKHYCKFYQEIADKLADYINRHRVSWGIATYVQEDGINVFINRPSLNASTWYEPHPCVTANAWGVPQLRSSLEIDALEKNAVLAANTFWWSNPYFTDAFLLTGYEYGQEGGTKLRQYFQKRGEVLKQLKNSAKSVRYMCPVMLATMAYAHKAASELDATAKTLETLSTQQGDNGSWPGTSYLKVAYPSAEESDRYFVGKKIEGGLVRDKSGLFSTAITVLILCNLIQGELSC